MKKLTFALIALVAFTVTSCSIFKGGPKTFEGHITYNIDYEGDIPEQAKAGLAQTIEAYYKGDLYAKVQESLAFSATNITNSTTGDMTMLMDIPMMGKKLAVTFPKTEMDSMQNEAKEEIPESIINETGETKEILGYKCKKVDVEFGDNVFPVYYTTEIATNIKNEAPFDKINGLLLEYTIEQNGITMHVMASNISTDKVSDENFAISEDYEKMSPEEFAKLFGGQ